MWLSVCGQDTDVGNMIQCESCSCWSHCICTNINITLAQTYLFVCSHCVKNSVLFSSNMATQVRKLEQSLTTLLRHTSDTLSTPVQTELDVMHESVSSLSSALPPSISQPDSVFTSTSYDPAVSNASMLHTSPNSAITAVAEKQTSHSVKNNNNKLRNMLSSRINISLAPFHIQTLFQIIIFYLTAILLPNHPIYFILHPHPLIKPPQLPTPVITPQGILPMSSLTSGKGHLSYHPQHLMPPIPPQHVCPPILSSVHILYLPSVLITSVLILL